MVGAGKLGMGSEKHPQAYRKMNAKSCPPEGLQRVP